MTKVIVVQPGGSEAISGGTSVRHVKIDIPSLHVTEYSVGAASMGDLHTHELHADAFCVLEGDLEVALSETETMLLGPRGFAVAPPGALHAFGVPKRARFLNIHAPGMSFAAYLREIVALGERGERPTREFDMHVRKGNDSWGIRDMPPTAGPAKNYWLLRLGSVAAVVGAVCAGVGNLLHPITPRDDPPGGAQVIAQSDY